MIGIIKGGHYLIITSKQLWILPYFNYASFMCERVLHQVINMHFVLSIVGSYVIVVFKDWIWLQLWYIQI